MTREALVGAGLSAAAVDSALRRGELRLLYRGVYALGQAPLRDEGVWLHAPPRHHGAPGIPHEACGGRVARASRTRPAGERRRDALGAAHVARHRGITRHPRDHLPARTVIDCAGTLTYPELRTLADRRRSP